MRRDADRQTNMLLAVRPDSLAPAEDPIRRIKPIVDAALLSGGGAWRSDSVLSAAPVSTQPRRRLAITVCVPRVAEWSGAIQSL